MSHDDEKWNAYPNTILRFGDHGSIDLRQPLSATGRNLLRSLELDEPFAVLTAENPCGQNAEDSANERQAEVRDQRNRERMRRLRALLDEREIRHVPVDGMSPDGEYCEHSEAIVIPRDKAIELAYDFEQLAIFWYDGRDFWLYPAVLDQKPERLPPASSRPTPAGAST